MCEALAKADPQSQETRRAIDLLVKIFKRKAQEVTSHTDRRRAQREQARAQRVATEEETPQEGGAEEVQPERVQAEAAAPQRVETTLTTENEASEPPPSLIPEDDDSLHSAYSEASIQGQESDDLIVEGMEIAYPKSPPNDNPIQITQDEDAPAYRTRLQRNMLMRVAEVAMGGISMAQSVRRKFFIKFLAEYANAVLD